MKYSSGDTVRFKLKSGEIREGDIRFIERNRSQDMLIISSFNRWDKVPEKSILSRVRKRINSRPEVSQKVRDL